MAKVDDSDRRIAARLADIRKSSGLTQKEAAAAIGASYGQYRKWESGAHRISAGRLSHLAEVFHTPIEAFYGDARYRIEGAHLALNKAYQNIQSKQLKWLAVTGIKHIEHVDRALFPGHGQEDEHA